MTLSMDAIEFTLPAELSATRPPEARGLARDEVRLLVSDESTLTHARFRELPDFLYPGDLVVVNNSAVLDAAVDAQYRDETGVLHFSTWLDDGGWVVELRDPRGVPWSGRPLESGAHVWLPDGQALELRAPWLAGGARLWIADLVPEVAITKAAVHGVAGTTVRPTGSGIDRGGAGDRSDGARSGIEGRGGGDRSDGSRMGFDRRGGGDAGDGVRRLLARYGRPITYAYVPERWSSSYYRTVFGREPGSAEMPSAGRPFTEALVTDLVAAGIALAPITLHTGVSSPETGEPPSPERFRVSASTARLVNAAHAAGGRVIAVGTTVTRALESAVGADGSVHAASGWTDLVLDGSRPARAVDGLITGWHAPGASHLHLLESVAGARVVRAAYRAALESGLLWHEFGDSALLFRD
ncbi:S-adenosylmethionine:tRNA ribosyltransferase-isomerase [Nocardia sp. NPDC020380]|uniref:S-adenosylmethionine:tRNA ribosyltransferase-isomerase n=1 Tax=Nocardia sp. NPDC020380 TaxID=3364309 RepID=UPI0037A5624F